MPKSVDDITGWEMLELLKFHPVEEPVWSYG